MISRRLIRIKVFQNLYTFFQSDYNNKIAAEKNLLHSFKKIHELFIVNLKILIDLARLSEERYEMNKKRYFKEEKFSNKLRHLSENIFIKELDENSDFRNYLNSYKSISIDDDILRKIIRLIENSTVYNEYQHFLEFNTASDIDYLKKIYKKYIYREPLLVSYLEEENLHWSQDQYYVGLMVISFLKNNAVEFTRDSFLPECFKPSEIEEEESDEEFAKTLFSLTIKHEEEYSEIISKYLQNWEPERIALTDMIIIKMAITEVINFPQIPIKSSINEYIEIAKDFSTPKSSLFVNGVLDKVISHYNRESKVNKIGRGLKEN